jgi:predicted RNA-binding Zn-ribbon protein involved in translation (DUF1610 family)
MKHRPCPPIIRKTVKWGGAAVTVLLVVVWIGSSALWRWPRRTPEWMGHGVVVRLLPGRVRVQIWEYVRLPPPKVWMDEAWTSKNPILAHLLFRVEDWVAINRVVSIPIGGAAACSLMLTMAAWRLDTLARRRAKLNLCPTCGYDRAGLARDAKCPECGRESIARYGHAVR